MNALRVGAGVVHWGHDMAYIEAPHQLGLDFICKPDKPIPFIGRDAYLKRKAAGKGPALRSLRLHDPDALLHHNEPVLKDGEIIGFVTSGAYNAKTGSAIGLCMITLPAGDARSSDLTGNYTVLVEGREIDAEITKKPITHSSKR